MANLRRGFVPKDEIEFNKNNLALLRRAQQDILYLLEQELYVKILEGRKYVDIALSLRRDL